MPELPDGTVTFLLTDVEGSTALWEQAPEQMRAALARHDALFGQHVAAHGGIDIKPRGEGDSHFAVFTRPGDAIHAALAVQRALAAESWPTPRPVTIRIGVNTGEAELRDGEYYGTVVNRCARLRGIGHGGQVLLSEATTALVRDGLTSDVTVRDLGEHRLKDLTRPERVFQLVVPDLRSDFPAVTSLNSRPHNLPIQPTPLLGRERDVQAVRDLLTRTDVRLVTLTGPGGMGKTTLGLHVTAELIDQFPDGAYIVALAPIANPELVPATIAQALELRDIGGRPILDSLKDFLRSRRLLLLLDNFEQILAAAPVVSDLLAAAPGLTVLVTSRAPLALRGEHEYPVPSLALPDRHRPPSAEVLSQYAAVALFVERAVAVKPDFAVTNENAPAVAEICHRLDGLPLAIELAAARARLLSPQAMLARLDRCLPLLTGGARDLPLRQQTLRGAIAWSYDLLNRDEQRLFRRLAVFVGGCSLEAVERVASNEVPESEGAIHCAPTDTAPVGAQFIAPSPLTPDPAILDLLESLVAKSLLRQEDAPDGDIRFRMLETIRELAAEQLDASGELAALRDRHLAYCLVFAQTAKAQLQGPQQAEWFDRLERENENLRAALEWSATASGPGGSASDDVLPGLSRVEAGTRLAEALGFFWVLRGRGRENLPHVMTLVALTPPGTAPHARAVTVAAHVHGHMLGNYQTALLLADEGLSTWRTLGDSHGIAIALVRRGQIAFETGDYSRATTLLSDARDLLREIGAPSGPEVPTACWLAEVAQAAGDLDRTQQLYDEVLAEARAKGDGHVVAHVLRELARLHRTRGDSERALARLRESAILLAPVKDVRCASILLEDIAGALCERSRLPDAARLFAASEVLRELTGKPMTHAQLAPHTRDVAAVERQLEPSAFAAAWAEGRAMTLEQAIAYAAERAAPHRRNERPLP